MIPTRPDASTDVRTPRGACRPASSVSSPKLPAVSKPYRMKIDMYMPSANVARMFPFWAASVPANEVMMLDRLVVGEEQQHEREHEHPQDLGRDADVVEDRQQADAERIDDRRGDERGDGDERVHVRDAERRRRIEELLSPAREAGDDVADDDRDRADREDLGPEVEPPGEPAEGAVGQPLRPLVGEPATGKWLANSANPRATKN